MIGAIATGTVAAMSVRRSIGRLTNWLDSAPSSKVSTNAARSSSPDLSGFRASVRSTTGISLRTQMTTPAARARKVSAMVRPSARFECCTRRTECTGKIRYAAMKPRPARVAITKHATTTRSARLAPGISCGSAGSSRRRGSGGPPGVPGSGVPSIDRASAGGGVPITRRRSVGPFPAEPPASWPVSEPPSGSLSPGHSPVVGSVMSLPLLRGDPKRGEHHEKQQPDEGHQALGDRADPPKAETAGVRFGARLGDIRDDVALLLRGDRGVVEHGHRLGPCEHRLIDLPGRGLCQRRGELAVCQRTALADEAVALRAVGHE